MVTELAPRSVLELPYLVEDTLSRDQREVFHRIFKLDYDEAPVVYPTEEARLKVAKQFGGEITTRRGLDLINQVLEEETLANPLRANRPLQLSADRLKTARQTVDSYASEQNNLPDNCSFCHPDTSSPQDPFGPVRGGRSMTIANAAAYSPWNSLVISDIHHPLQLSEQAFVDMVHTGNKWFQAAADFIPELRYPYAGWNGLFRGGGSIFHPHLQVISRRKPLQEVENLRKKMRNYENDHHYPYLDELAYCLRPLGLVFDIGSAHVVFNPVAKKEKEVFIYANDGNGLPNGDLSKATFKVLEWWNKRLGLTSFDMAIYMPPLGENLREWGDWHNFFPFVRLVDRGLEGDRTSDIGNMELYAASVVASDPFKLAQSFAEDLREQIAA